MSRSGKKGGSTKDTVKESVSLDLGPDRRGVVRFLKSGMGTLELDFETLRWLGLPVYVSGSRIEGTFQASVECGPTWQQKNRDERMARYRIMSEK